MESRYYRAENGWPTCESVINASRPREDGGPPGPAESPGSRGNRIGLARKLVESPSRVYHPRSQTTEPVENPGQFRLSPHRASRIGVGD